MEEEQIKQKFRELFPEYTVKNSEVCLSPYIDIFEAGIEIATKELEKENAEAKEIIRELLTVDYPTTTLEECKRIYQKAEAFLKVK